MRNFNPKKAVQALATLVVLVVIAAGCGGGESADGDGPSEGTTVPITEPVAEVDDAESDEVIDEGATAETTTTDQVDAPVVADRILVNAAAYTVNDAAPWAEAVAIADGRLVFVGDSDTAIAEYSGPDTEVVDLGGKMVLPGFIDSHAHPLQAAGLFDSLLLNGDGVQETLDAVVAYEETNDLPFVLGFGFDETQFLPDGPLKETLDGVVLDKPVILIDAGGHSAWANSAALDAFGIDADTPDPIPGKHYFQRDAAGEPTGWLVEAMAFNPYLAELGALDTDAIANRSNPAYGLLSSFGITTVFDAGASSFEDQALAAIAELRDTDGLPFRIVASHMIQHPDQVPVAIDRFRKLDEQYSEGLLTIGMIKIHNDGTTEALTSAMLEPFNNDPDNSGAVLLEADALATLVIEADQAGIEVHIHAIGDRAVREGLDAIQAMREANPSSVSRPTLAHVELVHPDDRPRFAELDVIVQTTPYWWTFDGSDEALGPDRAEQLYTYTDIAQSEARFSFGSDFPATGDSLLAAAPLWGIEAGITRTDPDNPDASPSRPDQVFDLENMIRGYTLDAAYQLKLENETGSLEVGKSADLVILDNNLFDIEPNLIHQTPIIATVLAGETTFGVLPTAG